MTIIDTSEELCTTAVAKNPVATALGVLLPTLPLTVLSGLAVWLAVVALWHYVSAGSMLAAIAVPIFAVVFSYPPPLVLTATVIALLILYKHRENMQRLLQGSESKLF